MTFADFLNTLHALQATQLTELRAAGVDLSPADWNRFRSNPARFLTEVSDRVAAGIFAVAQARAAALPRTALSATTCQGLADAFASLAVHAERMERADGRRLGIVARTDAVWGRLGTEFAA